MAETACRRRSELAFEGVVLLGELHVDIRVAGRELLERFLFVDQVGRAGDEQDVAGLDHGADHERDILRPVMLDERIGAAGCAAAALETNRAAEFCLRVGRLPSSRPWLPLPD